MNSTQPPNHPSPPPPQDSPEKPTQPFLFAPPKKNASRAIRIKLITLVAMLLLVIYSMKQAGNPKLWERLFKLPPQNDAELTSKNDHGESAAEDLPSVHSTSPSIQISPPSESDATESDASESDASESDASEFETKRAAPVNLHPILGNSIPKQDGVDYPVAAIRYWSHAYENLSVNQQSDLFHLLKSMRNGFTVPEQMQAPMQKLVHSLIATREQFHQDLFDELTLTSDRSPQKTIRSNELYASQEIWDEKISPAMNAAAQGEDFTFAQQIAIGQLQTVLDEFALNQVQDHQAIGWTGDSEAWKRIWERTVNDPIPNADAITRIQLMGQPNIYRGQPVTIEGWVRSARKQVLPADSKLGLPHYFILWVRPRETKLGPYCIYTQTLPPGFPELSETFSTLNERIRASGYFFKIRTYVATDRSILECPVLVTPSVERVVTPVPITYARWEPSRSTLIALFTAIPLIVIAATWFAFRPSKTTANRISKKREFQIDQTLSKLVDDPRVQTNQEKINSLYEKDLEND